MEVTVKNAETQYASDVVFGTMGDGSLLVRGKYSAIVIKSGTSYQAGDGWCEAGCPTKMKLHSVGTEITIKV
jgi:hypothetical protein